MPDVPHQRLLVETDGPVQWVTLNRPERRNAIDPTMTHELADHFTALHDDREVRVVVLRGAGKGFCAGLDVKAAQEGELDRVSRDRLSEMVVAIHTCPQVVVALVHGAACGGGFAIALAADVRILGTSARMNDAVVAMGGSGCELGLSYFLPRHLGLAAATELMLTGRFLDASRARELGLTAQVVPDEELEGAARVLVDDLLRVGPLALRRTKETLRAVGGLHDLAAVVDVEMAVQRECMSGPDFREGLRAFAERRRPVFVNRGAP